MSTGGWTAADECSEAAGGVRSDCWTCGAALDIARLPEVQRSLPVRRPLEGGRAAAGNTVADAGGERTAAGRLVVML